MLKPPELRAERRLLARVAARHQQDERHALAEAVVYLLRVLPVAAVGSRVAVAVHEICAALRKVARYDEQQHKNKRRYAYLHERAADPVRGGNDASVRGLVQELHRPQRERREEHHNGDIADGDALDKVHPKVAANAEAHKYQRKKAEHGRRRRSGNRDKGLLYGLYHGGFDVRLRPAQVFKSRKKKDRIIQRYGKLQNRAHGLRYV